MAKNPPRIVTLDELVAKGVFEKEFAIIKQDLERQQSITWQVVIGVAVAFILAVGVIVADATLARTTYTNETLTIQKEMNSQAMRLKDLSNIVDNIKIRNPYLK